MFCEFTKWVFFTDFVFYFFFGHNTVAQTDEKSVAKSNNKTGRTSVFRK